MKLKKTGTMLFIAMAATALVCATAAAATAPKRVLILPFHINAEKDLSFLQKGVLDMLSTRLSLAGKTVTIPKEEVRYAIENMPKPIEEKAAILLGASLGADYVALGSLTVFGTSISTDARFLDVAEQKPVVAFNQFGANHGDVLSHVNQFAGQVGQEVFGLQPRYAPAPGPAAAPAGPAPAPAAQAPASGRMHPEAAFNQAFGAGGGLIGAGGYQAPAGRLRLSVWKSRNFPVQIKGMAVGDVDGDGNKELVFIDNHTVNVYRLTDSRFSKVAEIESRISANHVSVDVADINGNGIAEIYVTALIGAAGRINSFVLEMDGGQLKRVAENLAHYFRVVEKPGRGPILVGQRQGIKDVFGRSVYEMVWNGDRLEVASKLKLPKKTNLYAFAFGDVMNNDTEMTVASTKNENLAIFSANGSEEWASESPYGGNPVYLEPPSSQERKSGRVNDDQYSENRVYLPQRIFVQDLDGDGKNEILAVRNKDRSGRALQRVRSFRSGHITCLQWEGIGLYEKWRVRKVSGHVADFAVADFDNDGEDEIVFAVVVRTESGVGKGKSYIAGQELK